MVLRFEEPHAALVRLLTQLARAAVPGFTFSAVYVKIDDRSVSGQKRNAMHQDKNNVGLSAIIGLGDYQGGRLVFEDGSAVDLRHQFCLFDAVQCRHRPEVWSGRRIVLSYFTHRGTRLRPAEAHCLANHGFPLPHLAPAADATRRAAERHTTALRDDETALATLHEVAASREVFACGPVKQALARRAADLEARMRRRSDRPPAEVVAWNHGPVIPKVEEEDDDDDDVAAILRTVFKDQAFSSPANDDSDDSDFRASRTRTKTISKKKRPSLKACRRAVVDDSSEDEGTSEEEENDDDAADASHPTTIARSGSSSSRTTTTMTTTKKRRRVGAARVVSPTPDLASSVERASFAIGATCQVLFAPDGFWYVATVTGRELRRASRSRTEMFYDVVFYEGHVSKACPSTSLRPAASPDLDDPYGIGAHGTLAYGGKQCPVIIHGLSSTQANVRMVSFLTDDGRHVKTKAVHTAEISPLGDRPTRVTL